MLSALNYSQEESMIFCPTDRMIANLTFKGPKVDALAACMLNEKNKMENVRNKIK